MAIQMRRGAYSAFNASKMLPGEFAVMLSGDPQVSDGKSVFIAFAANSVKRLATWDDASQLIAAAMAEGIDLSITSGNDAISVASESDDGAAFTLTHKSPFSAGKAGLDPASSSIGSGNTSLGSTQLDFGDGFWVPCVTMDRYGHITGLTYRKLVLPMGGYATEDKAGTVRPDGVSITVDASGVIRALRPPVDSALSDTSEYAVQNKVVKAALDLKAPLASPALTGTPTAPTAPTGTDTTQIATTEFVRAAISAAVAAVCVYRGTVATFADLPSSGLSVGDVYNVTAAYGDHPAGTNWAWDGTAWDALGGSIDLSAYATDTFAAVDAGGTTMAANSKADTLTIAAGANVTVTGDASTDTVTISATDTTYGNATDQAAGLMSATDKAKLDGVATGAQANVIETVKVNGTALTPSGKAVDVTVPTKASDLTNDAGYLDAEGPFDATRLTGTVPAANLPSYVDDVVEGYLYQGAFYEESSHATAMAGEAGKVYVDLADDSTYRWSGSAYVSISNPIDFATQAEAEGGVENTKAMTALRTKQAIDANAYAHPTSAASGSYGDASDQAPAWGGAFKATSQTVDANGHVTAAAEHTVTIPSSTATDAAAGLMSAADHAALTAAVVDVTNLDARVTSLEHPVPEWDDDAGRYTDESVAGWLGNMRDGLSYGVSVPKGSATACTKTGANAGIAVPVPGIVGRAAVDPYALLGPFRHFDVNGYVDPDGTPHVTAIQGDGRFKRDGTNGNVWVLAPVLWWSMDSGGDAVEIYVSDTRLAGMAAQPQAYLPDGTLRPFMLYAKYVGSNDGGGMMASVSGRKPWTYNVSHNSLITQCKNATTGYSGKSIADDWYVKAMFLVKYATKNSQSVFAGCTSYDVTAQVTVAESGTSRVIVSTANADKLVVGSAVMVGTANTDRNNATAHDIVDSARILSIEAYDSSNSAVALDVAATFTTATTHYLKSAPWRTGACDDVEGDGSPTSCTSGKEPFKIQGIETAMGFYELIGDVIVNSDGSTGWEICICHDSRGEATSVTANYAHTGKFLHSDTTDSWKYPMYPDSADGMLFGASYGASQSTGMCDGSYTNKKTTSGTREWRGLGYLNLAGDAGLWCVSASNALADARWNFGSRLSATGRALAA